MKLDTLMKLWIHELKDLYSAETQLLEALPRVRAAARDADLKEALAGHLDETRIHVKRLEKVFAGLEFSPAGQRCKGMEGLIEEATHALETDAEPEVRDAAIIAAAQRIEHYEIAAYGTAAAFAEALGEHDACSLLQVTLDEESRADVRLSRLARRRVNFKAMALALAS